MTQENGKNTESILNLLFQEARSEVQPPSERLMQAVLRDATAEMQGQRPRPPSEAGWFGRALIGLGGWQSATALAVSACVGLLIGYAVPDSADIFNTGLSVEINVSADLSTDLTEADFSLYSDIEDLLTEGS